jgi:hypothetical protein
VTVGDDVGLGVRVGVGVRFGVAVRVGLGVGVGVGLEVSARVADEAWAGVGEACLTGVYPADWDVGCLVGVFVGLEVLVRVAGFPRSDAVGVTPLCLPPDECAASRTPSTAPTIIAAATAVMGQRHRRNGDGRLTGGVPPVPPGTSRPASVTGPGTGTRDVDVSGRRLCPTLVAETGAGAEDGGMTAWTVGS